MKRDIDTTRPHIGRIYDYLLGGTQNFEADRQVADMLLSKLPMIRFWAQMNRWFLQFIAYRWSEEGRTHVLDLGSALPTQGHFNEYLSGKHVLFSDFDALCVEYGQELLKNEPHMRYVQADMREPGPLLAAAAQLFGDERRIAVGCIGIAYFLTDDQLRHLMKTLHDFCAPGSVMAVSYFTPPPGGGIMEQMMGVYRQMVNTGLYMRKPDDMVELIQPWRVSEHASLDSWLDLKHLANDETTFKGQFSGQGLIALRA